METLTISTADGSITDTQVDSGGLLNSDDGSVGIDSRSIGSVTVPEGAKPLYSADNYPIYSLSNVPVYESIIEESDDLSGYQVIGEATITIDWSSSGLSDLDCCAYWSDNSGYKIGWSYGNGSLWDENYRAWWTGDDTGNGPEQIALLVTAARRCPAESSPYQFKVHLNFYGDSSGGTPTATVSVTVGSTTLSTSITPGTNQGNAATTSDPYVTITFASDGTPTAIS